MSGYELRFYQEEAVSAVLSAFDERRDRVQVLSACGTGKTVTMLAVHERMGSRLTGFFCPTLSLLAQTVERWREFAGAEAFDPLIVCSDLSVGRSHRDKDDDLTEGNLRGSFPDVRVVRSAREIRDYLRYPARPRVVFGTYQSSAKIKEAQELLDPAPDFDLIIADEAHYLGAERRTDRNGEPVRIGIKARHRIFTTATQRNVRVSKEEEVSTIASMDDEAIFGRVVYELSLRDAINLPPQGNGLPVLTDYKVIAMRFTRDDLNSVSGSLADSTDVEKQQVRRALGVLAINLLRKHYDVKSILSYHTRVSQARQFCAELKSVDFNAEVIVGDTPMKERKIILDKLKEGGVVTNVNCLTEGIDVPAIEAVLLVDPRESEIDIVQIAGRAIRPRADKEVGYIVIPILDTDDSKANPYDPVLRVLRKMAANDERLQSEINADEVEHERRRSGLGPILVVDGDALPLAAELRHEIQTQVLDLAHTAEAKWQQKADTYFAMRADGMKLDRFSTNEEVRTTANWINNQRSAAQQGKLSAERLDYMDRHGLGWRSARPTEEEWLEAAEGYRTVHAKGINPTTSHPDQLVREVGKWLTSQRTSKTLSEHQIWYLNEVNPRWRGNDHDQKWINQLERYVGFMSRGIKPRANSSDAAEKAAAQWMNNVRQQDDLAPKRRELLDEHIPTWNYPTDKTWLRQADVFFDFMESHDAEPAASSIKQAPLAQWIAVQRADQSLDRRKAALLDSRYPQWRDDPQTDSDMTPIEEWRAQADAYLRLVSRGMHVSATSKTSAAAESAVWLGRQQRDRNLARDRRRYLDQRDPRWSDTHRAELLAPWPKNRSYVIQALVERDGAVCLLCGQPIDLTREFGSVDAVQVDHEIARSRGGTNAWTNLRLSHATCNDFRQDGVPEPSKAEYDVNFKRATRDQANPVVWWAMRATDLQQRILDSLRKVVMSREIDSSAHEIRNRERELARNMSALKNVREKLDAAAGGTFDYAHATDVDPRLAHLVLPSDFDALVDELRNQSNPGYQPDSEAVQTLRDHFREDAGLPERHQTNR